MRKPLAVYILTFYATFSLIVLMITGLATLIFKESVLRGLEGMEGFVLSSSLFQALMAIILFLSCVGLWNRFKQSQTFYLVGSLLTMAGAFMFGILPIVILQSAFYFIVVTIFMFSKPVSTYLELEPEEFMVWYERNKMFGRVKSPNSDLSKLFGVILFGVGAFAIITSGFYFPVDAPFVDILSWLFLLFGIVIWFTGAFLWGISRLNMTLGLTAMITGTLWAIGMVMFYVISTTDFLATIIQDELIVSVIEDAQLFKLNAIFMVGIIGLIKLLGGYLLVRNQLSKDAQVVATAEF